MSEYQAKAQRALSLVNSGRYREAIPQLRELLRYTYVVDFEYDDWLRALADSTRAINNPIPAGYIYLYLHYFEKAHVCFEQARSNLDLALCHEVRRNYKDAAQLYQREGYYVRAAINLEQTKHWDTAIAAWEQARSNIHRAEQPYPYALATVNLALALRHAGKLTRVRDLLVEAITIIEGLADEWEGYGFMDESLGAYHVLCKIGQVEQRFENLAEGYCNAIRLLREQGQTYRVFRYYAALTEFGENLGEDHAVATLHREAADYAVRRGTMYQTYYLKRAAEAYMRVAGQTRERGNFPELAENAYLAAIDAYNQMGDLENVERCYKALASLNLDEERTERYTRIAQETRTIDRAPPEIYSPSPLLLMPPDLPPVWISELKEWEAGDDPIGVLTNIVWNLEFGDVARRQALNLVLYHLDLRDKNTQSDADLLRQIAQAMSGLKYTIAYKTLRRLVDSEHTVVRAEVMTSAGRMTHPKGFILLEMGLADKDESVRSAALEAIRGHVYNEAHDHLVRLYQDHSRIEVRRTVLETLGQTGAIEAAEFLWSVLRSTAENEDERTIQSIAARVFSRMLKPEWRSIFQSQLSTEPDHIRKRLKPLLTGKK